MKHIAYNRKPKTENYFQKRGQVLLVAIMLLATTLTIALAVSFKSTTDTQVAKLEEDSQRALAAAEAGIEAAIRQGNVNLNTLNLGIGISGVATIDTTSSKTSFITPLLQKDEQYTLYLTPYDRVTDTFGAGAYDGGAMTIYFGQNNNCPTLELTVMSKDGTYLEKKLVKEASPVCDAGIQGNSTYSVSNPGASDTVNGQAFSYKATIPSVDLTSGNLLFIRVLHSSSNISTPIGIKVAQNALEIQGNTITSQATTATGVTKKVQLFQSGPQIPAEFFVTQF